MENNQVRSIYNQIVRDKFKGDYEHNRWFKDELSKAGYDMTKKTIERHFLNQADFKNYLEVGPGPGTWTALFLEKNSQAEFNLVDISAEMLKLAEKKLSGRGRISFFETDFLKFSSDKKYDLFFSSRALEYFSDKNGFIGQAGDLLANGGGGLIITKLPKYWRYKITGRKVPAMHQNQINPIELKRILSANGFININFYPAVMIFPFFRSIRLDKILYKIFGGLKLNFLSRQFAESYCVKFTKK